MMSNILIRVVGRRFASTQHNIGDKMKMLNEKREYRKALELFDTFNENNIDQCSNWTVIQALKASSETNDIARGVKIHNLIATRLKTDSYVLPSLIHFYMQIGDVTRAQSLYDTSTRKTLFLYGAMMRGFIKNKMCQKVIDLFNEIKDPNEIVVTLVINACSQLATKDTLKILNMISSKIPISFYNDTHILASLIDAFMKCGDLLSAKRIFQTARKKTLFMYGAMTKGFILNNMPEEAINLFNEIENPDEVNFVLLFNGCAQLGTDKELKILKNISSKLPISFYKDPYVLTSLIDAFMKCGDVENAKLFFNKSEKKTLPMYGALLKGLVTNDQAEEAIDVFNEMSLDEVQGENHVKARRKFSLEIKDDYIETKRIIYSCLIKAFSKIGMSDRAQAVVQKIPTFFLTDNVLQNALIDMWGKVGCVDEAKRIFEQLTRPDNIAYTAMINSYGLNGMGSEAIELFRQISKEYIDDFTYVSVLNACSHSGLVDEARSIFNNIPIKTDKIYTTMIDCLSRISAFEEAQNLIEEYELDRSAEPAMYSQY